MLLNMRVIIINIFLLLLLVFLFSCSDEKNDNIVSISVDISNAQLFSKSRDNVQILSLDTATIALQGEVYSIIFLENIIAVRTSNRLSLFDNHCIYIRDLGRLGRAGNEFITLSSVFFENDTFELFDVEGQKILRFDTTGIFIGSKSFDKNNEFSVSRINSFFDSYIALNRYRGELVKTPTLVLFDKDLYQKNTTGKNLISGFTLHNVFSYYSNEMLFWNIFDYNIYSIEKDFILKPKYFINFGKYSIPKNIYRMNNAEKIMEYLLNNEKVVVSSIQYVIENESYLNFTFSLDSTYYLVIFNKKDGKTKVYELKLSEHFYFYPFMTIHEDNYVFCGVDTSNPLSNVEIIFIKQNIIQ